MCRLNAHQTSRSGTSHCKGAHAGQASYPVRKGPRAPSFSHRRRLDINAVAVQQRPIKQAESSRVEVRQAPGLRQQVGSNLPDISGSLPIIRQVVPVAQQASTVEVHLEVQYGCQFGQHVSIVGSPQGWHFPAAVTMTWSEGDVWKAVLPVPAGTDIEYKYLVQWDDGRVARWQDGPNNSLAVQHPGVLMHVQDTWSQQDRSVREVGMRLTNSQQPRQSGGHSSGAAPTSAAAAAPAAVPFAELSTPSAEGPVTAQAATAAAAESALAAAAAPPSSSSEDSHAQIEQQQPPVLLDAAAVLPIQSTWDGVLPLPQHALVFDQLRHFDTAAAADDDDEIHYEDEGEDQHWPAVMFQKAATAAAAAASALPAVPSYTAAAAAPQLGATAVPGKSAAGASTDDSARMGAITSSPASSSSSSKQQQSAAGSLAQLLPLLRTELRVSPSRAGKAPRGTPGTWQPTD